MRENICGRDERGGAPPSLCQRNRNSVCAIMLIVDVGRATAVHIINEQVYTKSRCTLVYRISSAPSSSRSTFPTFIARCITFLYHALGEEAADDGPTLASMDFSASGKSISSGSGSGGGGGKGYGVRGRYKLIVASNRDEFLGRPTAPIHFWEDANSNLLAGIPAT